jgi:hypothetical protein
MDKIPDDVLLAFDKRAFYGLILSRPDLDGNWVKPEDRQSAIVRMLIAQWAHSAADDHSLSLALQEAARREFDLPDWHKPNISSGRQEDVDSLLKDYEPILRAFIRAQHQATVAQLRADGVKTVKVVRGTSQDIDSGRHIIRLNPMSSFTVSTDTAWEFAHGIEGGGTGEYPRVVAIEVPVDKVIGMPGTGVGALHEFELVLMGGDYPATIMSRESSAKLPVVAAGSEPAPIELDRDGEEDWIKTLAWDLSTDPKDFTQAELLKLSTLPAWKAAPPQIKAALRQGRGYLPPVTAAGNSWRWQLRDSKGQWIEMHSEVKWLANGVLRSGRVTGSPSPGVATVRDADGNEHDLSSNRLTALKPDPSKMSTPGPDTGQRRGLRRVVQRKTQKAEIAFKQTPAMEEAMNDMADIIRTDVAPENQAAAIDATADVIVGKIAENLPKRQQLLATVKALRERGVDAQRRLAVYVQTRPQLQKLFDKASFWAHEFIGDQGATDNPTPSWTAIPTLIGLPSPASHPAEFLVESGKMIGQLLKAASSLVGSGRAPAVVRTPEGAKKYGQSIGSVIALDPPDLLVSKRMVKARAEVLSPTPKPPIEKVPIQVWEREEMRREVIQSYVGAVHEDGTPMSAPAYMLNDEAINSRIKYMGRPKPKEVLRRGGVDVITWQKQKGPAGRRTGKMTKETAEILEHAEWLQAVDPTHDGRTIISLRDNPRNEDWEAYAELNENWMVMDVDWVSLYQSGHSSSWDMPTKVGYPSSLFSMTHEYGHMRDDRTDEQRAEDDVAIKNVSGMSEYGNTNINEAYAEAYAEWILSYGTTTNDAALYFANKYGWPIPKEPNKWRA